MSVQKYIDPEATAEALGREAYVPDDVIPEIVFDVAPIVLFVSVWVVSIPTSVVEASGTVRVRVVAVVMPDSWNFNCLVASPSSCNVKFVSLTVATFELSNVLLLSVSVLVADIADIADRAAVALAAVRTERPVAVESVMSVEFNVVERDPLATTQTYAFVAGATANVNVIVFVEVR